MHKGLSLTVLVLLGCGAEVSVPEALKQAAPSAPAECHVFTGAGSVVPEALPPEKKPSRCDDPALQGELVASPVPTSLAISGSGFFVLETSRGLRFTRWGEFSIDPDGFFVTNNGHRVQGLNAEKQLKPLRVRNVHLLAEATTSVTFMAKLDPNATIQTFEPLNPANTNNFNASVTIFDSLGQSHDVTVYFNRTATGSWDWRALVSDGSALTGGTAGVPAEIAAGTMTFDTQGRLDTVTQHSAFNPINAINPQPLHFAFGDDLTSGGTGLGGVVQNIGGNRNELTFSAQDGVAAGTLSQFTVDVEGRLIASFTNGRRQELARFALANFAYARGLHRDSDGTLAETKESGHAIIGAPVDWLFGAIRAQMLELPCQP
ncbi:MAG: flagellar hook-basal body complex protein [Archangium sp.]|nr:flagellar hook-basal body complex protein [Archangium sp.]